jgi:cation transport regulator ChaB
MQETMITLTQYGLMAEKHWREFLPRMVKNLEAHGRLQEALLEAEEKTKDEMYDLTTRLRTQGLTAQQAHDQAWEMVREEYILLTPEETA